VIVRTCGLTRIRLQLAICFCLHRGSLPEKTASWQARFRPTRSRSFVSLCRCRVEGKSGRIRRVKYWTTTLAILATLSASLALAEDFKTVNGKEYKNATVTRVEPDGIVIKFRGGIAKLQFTELLKEVQERFHYDSAKAAQFNAAERPFVFTNFKSGEGVDQIAKFVIEKGGLAKESDTLIR